MDTSGHNASQSTPEVWTIDAILRWTQAYFERQGISGARLDAEVLLAHALGCDRVRLYTHFDQPLRASERDAYRALVKRRAAHEPVAYILGRREFYGRDFAVDSNVLIPRPETEHVVESALAWARARPEQALRILDVGSGSGALAVTLAAELPTALVTAADISPEALQKTQANAERHGVHARVACVVSDLLTQITGTFDIIVSNPPYIGEHERATLPVDVVRYEPALALFAGDAGLALIRRLSTAVPAHLARPGLFLCEMGHTQKDAVLTCFPSGSFWSRAEVLPDLQGHPRVLVAECIA